MIFPNHRSAILHKAVLLAGLLIALPVTAIEVPFLTEHAIDSSSDAFSVAAADVDGDADLDVLVAAGGDDSISWWENTAGDGSAWTEHTIDAAFAGARSVAAADVEGEGDLDVLGAANGDDAI